MAQKVRHVEEFVVVGGIPIRVELAGAGDPLLLIHGLGGPPTWRSVTNPLGEHFRVIAVDLPGFGDSGCPDHAFTTEEFASALEGLLDGIEIPSCAVAGISYGGQIAVHVAAHHARRVSSIILIASTGMGRPGRLMRSGFFWRLAGFLLKYSILRSRGILCRLGGRAFYRLESRPRDLCDSFYEKLSLPGKRDGWLAALRNVFREGEEFRKNLAAIRDIPALIIWGEHDRTVGLDEGRELHNLLAGSVMAVVSECAHSVPLEKPAQLCGEIEKFIESRRNHSTKKG